VGSLLHGLKKTVYQNFARHLTNRRDRLTLIEVSTHLVPLFVVVTEQEEVTECDITRKGELGYECASQFYTLFNGYLGRDGLSRSRSARARMSLAFLDAIAQGAIEDGQNQSSEEH
jgi:hypothetical protein